MSAKMKRANYEDNDIELLERDDPLQRMPFLGSGSNVGKTVGSRFFNYGRHFRKIGIFFAVLVLLVFVFNTWGDAFLDWLHSDFDDALTPDRDRGQTLHILIPATHKDINLCKTTLGLNILGYPDPTFLGWDVKYNDKSMVDDGARIGSKITQALAYVNKITDEEDLVLIADGYDTWFQLPEEVLRKRYYLALAGAHYRMRHRIGRRAIRRESMKDRVVFAAGKTCTPNGLHTVACYPIMKPPTSPEMYGSNTDTHVGHSKHSSFRPRYLDAGFMMGPVKDVKKVLERAQELIDTFPESEPFDTPFSTKDEGSGQDEPSGSRSAHVYHGDPQAIFARIFGQQVFQREVIRLRYRSWFKKFSPPHMAGSVEEKKYPDLLRPPFPHEKMKRMEGHPMEYRITLDYTGLIGSSTANSEHDFVAKKFDDSWAGESLKLGEYDCKPRLNGTLPDDVKAAAMPKVASDAVGPADWSSARNLWGNICNGHIPVLVHHNGDKKLRDKWWSDVWYQKDARKMLQKLDETNHAGVDLTEGRKPGVGGWTADGKWLGFRSICPKNWDDKIFDKGS